MANIICDVEDCGYNDSGECMRSNIGINDERGCDYADCEDYNPFLLKQEGEDTEVYCNADCCVNHDGTCKCTLDELNVNEEGECDLYEQGGRS